MRAVTHKQANYLIRTVISSSFLYSLKILFENSYEYEQIMATGLDSTVSICAETFPLGSRTDYTSVHALPPFDVRYFSTALLLKIFPLEFQKPGCQYDLFIIQTVCAAFVIVHAASE